MVIKNNDNNTSENKLFNPYEVNESDLLFITLIQNRINGYGQIPYNVPTNLIIDVIKSSAKYFYQWYPLSLHQSFYAIKVSDIINIQGYNDFNKKTIKLNPRIKAIIKCYEAIPYYSKNDDFNIMDMQSTIAGGYVAINGSGINNNLFLIENAVKMVELSALKQMFKTTVSFRFNMYNHELIFKKMPKVDTIILDCLVCNDISTLYQDNFFERHVIANVKKELKRIIGGHTIPLPGGATLNVDEICNNIDDIENIETLIRAMNGTGDILSTR